MLCALVHSFGSGGGIRQLYDGQLYYEECRLHFDTGTSQVFDWCDYQRLSLPVLIEI
jgi:hypothetical protein